MLILILLLLLVLVVVAGGGGESFSGGVSEVKERGVPKPANLGCRIVATFVHLSWLPLSALCFDLTRKYILPFIFSRALSSTAFTLKHLSIVCRAIFGEPVVVEYVSGAKRNYDVESPDASRELLICIYPAQVPLL